MSVSAVGAELKVVDAIERASARSGIGFDYLLATARRESGLDCQATSKTSSACGLYQFVAQTWLATLKAHGAEHGLQAYAADIERTPSGQLTVADPARRGEILALRQDPGIAASLAAALTADNGRVLESRLGRAPSDGELYAAHVLGASAAARLITLAQSAPGAPAADHFPEAAASNRGLFYDKAGAPVSVSALAARLAGETAVRTVSALRPSVDMPAAPAVAASFVPSAPPSATIQSGNGWRSGMVQAPLALTPQVLAILSSLDAPESGSFHHKSKSRI